MKAKTVFFCTDCGNETPRWEGKCQACGSWNTITEQPMEPKTKSGAAPARAVRAQNVPRKLTELDASVEARFTTGLGELDRVLGGGAVTGSLVLVGGEPGIGKSTLLLQMCAELGRAATVLYVSGEESERQLKLRAERLGVSAAGVYVMAETDMGEVSAAAEELKPDVLIIDSIQTLYNSELSSSPGSVGQVKDCTTRLMHLSKSGGITVFLVGHVNKEGAIAGPKVLEHMVDCVLYFEGERSMNYRILRAAKNRYGSISEIGVFEMLDTGLAEAPDPSEILLAGRQAVLGSPGTCVTCVVEGTRPILAEIQALVTPSSYSVPRRNSNGVEWGRAMMLLAVLQQRGGLRVGGCDAYINVIGGLNLDEPGADLATVLALASSYRDKPLPDDLVAIGEVGLTGELRQVSQMNMRLNEIARMGFTRCVLPGGTRGKLNVPKGLELIHAKTITDAMKLLYKE